MNADLAVAKMLGWTDMQQDPFTLRECMCGRDSSGEAREVPGYVSAPTPESEAEVLAFVQHSCSGQKMAIFSSKCSRIWSKRQAGAVVPSSLWMFYKCGDYAQALLAALAEKGEG